MGITDRETLSLRTWMWECVSADREEKVFIMVRSRQIQIRIPSKTYDRLVEFAESEGVTASSGKPVVAQTVRKMIRLFLDAHADPEWEKLRGESGGNTFGMMDSAVTEHLKKRLKGNF